MLRILTDRGESWYQGYNGGTCAFALAELTLTCASEALLASAGFLQGIYFVEFGMSNRCKDEMANSLSYGNIEWFWESISDYGFNFTSVVWVYSTEGYIDNNNNNNFDNTQLKAAASIGDHSLEPCMPLYST